MKAIVCLMISTVINVAVSESELCSSIANDVCKYHETFPMDYPNTVEDMKQGCQKIEQLVRCFLNYYEKCGGYEEQIPSVENFLKFIEEKCQEDSDAFQAISSKLDCFTPTLKSLDEECSIDYMVEEDMESLIVQARNVFADVQLFDAVDCLEAVWQIQCKSHTMGKRCGSELTDVLAEILENTNFKYIHKCTTKLLTEFASLKVDIEQVVSEGKSQENTTVV